ncbi:MAG TPA: EAL domain-containing protein [Acidimicrobiales bacterium]|nr:EAL domain-containing protein [Acidimicrobiales bacterium]
MKVKPQGPRAGGGPLNREASASDPGHLLVPFRLRGVRIGLQMTFMVLGMLAAYAVLPGHHPLDGRAYTILLLVAADSAFVISRLPWEQLLNRPTGNRYLYAWAVLDILLITVAISMTGHGDSELVFLYALTTVFFAASYPLLSQVVLLFFTCVVYTGLLGLDGFENVTSAAMAVRIGGLALVGFVASFLSRELLRQMRQHGEARTESESRAGLLAMVASASRSMSTLDPEQVLGIVVESALQMGFDSGEICLFDNSTDTWRVAQHRGLDADYASVEPIDAGVAGLVHSRRETVVLDSYSGWPGGLGQVRDAGFRFMIASPVWCGGELAGALVAGSLDRRTPRPHEVECLDLLAAQAGAALNNARLFSERRAFEARLEHQAFHDGLTNLPNRALFLDRLEQALARTRRDGAPLGVLFMDLDRFKMVNDSLGHDVGDELLAAVAQRLNECLRPGDTLARYGGDEFTVLLERLRSDADATEVAERLLRSMSEPFVLQEREVFVSASIGVSFTKAPMSDDGDPLREADLAMYRAKERGKGRWEVFKSEMNAEAVQRLELETELRQAIDRQELFVLYQPLIELGSGRITGVEALVRWHHPRRGVVVPGEFVGLAEETGLILRMGTWVLEEACRQGRQWLDEGLAPLHIAVNISADQFQKGGLPDQLRRILDSSGLPAERLTLEMTESVVMEEAEATMHIMGEIDNLGVRLALDDFGQGYSSLSYLKRFPLDVLKVDKAFVDGLVDNAEDRAIVRSVVALARELGISVTAEGIETARQLEEVVALGCDVGQGYWFSRPVAAEAIAELMRAAEPAEPSEPADGNGGQSSSALSSGTVPAARRTA